VYLSTEELFYIRLNGRICTKKKLPVPPSGRLISIRWNGSNNYWAVADKSEIVSRDGKNVTSSSCHKISISTKDN
jgi:hypothetical protein